METSKGAVATKIACATAEFGQNAVKPSGCLLIFGFVHVWLISTIDFVVAEADEVHHSCLLQLWQPEVPRQCNLFICGNKPIADEPEVVFRRIGKVGVEDGIGLATPADVASL